MLWLFGAASAVDGRSRRRPARSRPPRSDSSSVWPPRAPLLFLVVFVPVNLVIIDWLTGLRVRRSCAHDRGAHGCGSRRDRGRLGPARGDARSRASRPFAGLVVAGVLAIATAVGTLLVSRPTLPRVRAGLSAHASRPPTGPRLRRPEAGEVRYARPRNDERHERSTPCSSSASVPARSRSHGRRARSERDRRHGRLGHAAWSPGSSARRGMFTGARLNAYEDALAVRRVLRPLDQRVRAEQGAPASDGPARSGCGPILTPLVRTHLADLPRSATAWGWKEPRSIYLVPFLDAAMPSLRFLHFVRDGRDMAFSENQNQLRQARRRRAPRGAAEGEDAGPVDRGLESGERGGRRLRRGAASASATCASDSRISARSPADDRRAHLRASSDSTATPRRPRRRCARRHARPLAAPTQAHRRRPPSHRRARRSRASATSSRFRIPSRPTGGSGFLQGGFDEIPAVPPGCAARPESCVPQSRFVASGYERSLRHCLGTTIAPRREQYPPNPPNRKGSLWPPGVWNRVWSGSARLRSGLQRPVPIVYFHAR